MIPRKILPLHEAIERTLINVRERHLDTFTKTGALWLLEPIIPPNLREISVRNYKLYWQILAAATDLKLVVDEVPRLRTNAAVKLLTDLAMLGDMVDGLEQRAP